MAKKLPEVKHEQYNKWTQQAKCTKKGKVLLKMADLDLQDQNLTNIERQRIYLTKETIVIEHRHGIWFYVVVILLLISIFGSFFIPLVY